MVIRRSFVLVLSFLVDRPPSEKEVWILGSSLRLFGGGQIVLQHVVLQPETLIVPELGTRSQIGRIKVNNCDVFHVKGCFAT